MSDTPPVCDYEGSDYRTRFWENQGREYEDQTERIALRRLMPPKGKTLIDLGAGFGRLADEFTGYDQVVLFDYSRSLLEEARERWGDDPRYLYVAGDWYKMPFVNNLFETMVQVRTIHHAADVPKLFSQLHRISRPQGHYILEFANKQNLKAIGRYMLGRQKWSPFDEEPIEFVELNFDFHPNYIREHLATTGFKSERTLTTSHYRIGILKRTVPTGILVNLDKMAQLTGDWWQLTPSVFIKNRTAKPAVGASTVGFFACPECGTSLTESDNQLPCEPCQLVWEKKNGIYDFKEPTKLT